MVPAPTHKQTRTQYMRTQQNKQEHPLHLSRGDLSFGGHVVHVKSCVPFLCHHTLPLARWLARLLALLGFAVRTSCGTPA